MAFSSWLLIAYVLTVLGVMGTVLSENRNPLKASAWILIVGLVPVFGIMVYIVFGQDQRRLHSINRRFYQRLMRKPQLLSLPKHLQKKRQATEENQRLIELLLRNSESPLLQLQTLDIYAWGRGSYNVPASYWKRMRAAGIQVYAFMRVAFPLLSTTVNYRNHRKIVVIDGSVGYVGGMNFAQRYLTGTELGMWRDTHFRLTGVAVAGLQGSFLVDWYAVSRKVVNMDRYFDPSVLPNEYSPSVQFVQGGPISHWRTLEQAIIYMISRASERICIQTPYFLPTENLNNAIITSALAGVEVELMLPERTDSRLTTFAANSYLSQLLEAGVKIYQYREGFLHSKLLMVDDRIASIGSANMDFRSLEHNFEISGFVYDPGITKRLTTLFDQDKSACHLLTREEWEKRGRLVRFSESVMRLFAPLL